MNLLDLSILFYEILVFFKLIVNLVSSCTIGVLSAIVLASMENIDTFIFIVLIGMLLSSIISIFYIIKTLLFNITYKIYELPRAFILFWSLFSTYGIVQYVGPYKSYLVATLVTSYIVGICHVFIMRFPYGEDGEIRV